MSEQKSNIHMNSPGLRGGFWNLCAVSAGSCAFILLLSIGAYHILYKGVPVWHSSESGLAEGRLHIEGFYFSKGKIVFEYFTPETGPVEIKVVAPNGRVLLEKTRELSEGNHALTLDSAKYSGGKDYVLEISVGDDAIEKTFAVR